MLYKLLCCYQKTEVYPSVSTFPSNPIVIEGNEEAIPSLNRQKEELIFSKHADLYVISMSLIIHDSSYPFRLISIRKFNNITNYNNLIHKQVRR